MAAARNALRRATEIVGVVAEQAPAYALSFAQRRVVETDATTAIADGLAVRRPNADAVAVIVQNVARMVKVSDPEIMGAMCALYEDTHNLAEGAGAAALAAAMKERENLRGKRIGAVLTGGNVDRATYAAVLS
ncbi:MAG TPA: pyridoxal-phosphate dependent enzyme [Terracidiphilus sp.]|nr:pyridoxal-phosphate dependent enzyme [Terracidiphilus sp.]